ncbi:hypothetical protein [Halovivax sp.]|uniref:hypothetical protein n=1 Tax=Halovivax sp. TaxID=1935978 RepID=UPI0025C65AAB|nr:hypothetical protein [Halovivax sp.]
MARYYDLVLGLIPVSLVGVAAALVVVGLPTTTAVPVGALVASLLIGHAMFVNAPLDDSEEVGASRGSTNQPPSMNAD